MTDKKTEALKPCEYCGHPLPQGVDKRTRQIRSHHFASCKVRLEQKALADHAVTLPDEGVHNIRPLYTSPQPSKPWVGLTSADRVEILRAAGEAAAMLLTEAKLKARNT